MVCTRAGQSDCRLELFSRVHRGPKTEALRSLIVPGNLERILESIRIAEDRGAKLRIGPELEITYALPNLWFI